MASRNQQFANPGRRLAALFSISLILSAGSLAGLLAGALDATPVSAAHIKLVCSTALFVGVNRSELISTAKLWVQTLGKREGLAFTDVDVSLADNVRELRTQADIGDVDLFITSSLEYLAMDRVRALTPEITLTAAPRETGKTKYLLLVNRDSGINALTDLSGKVLNAYSRSASNLNRLWLDVLLDAAHLSAADTLFRSVSISPKPTVACLPVFFGKADSCLVDGPSWDTLRELNPQIATKLKVLAESQPLVESLISMRSNRQEQRSEIIHAMRTLQDDPEGRQVLLLFKCSRAVSIESADLEPVAQLRSTYLKNVRPADRRIVLPGVSSGPAAAPVSKSP